MTTRIMASLILIVVTGTTGAVERNGFVLDNALVPVDEIFQGGPGRDGIPALYFPDFVDADQAGFLNPGDRVLGLNIDGLAKAYPILIMNYHEVVNDKLGEHWVAVSFCPLCGTGMVFDAGQGRARRTFGVSGLLYNSDALLYDSQSESLWSQLMTRAVTGPSQGESLELLPVAHTTWRKWRERYPDTLVLSENTGYDRDYSADPYRDYARRNRLMFPVNNDDGRLRAKQRIIGVSIDGHNRAYAFNKLSRRKSRIDDTLGDTPIVIEYDRRAATGRVLDSNGHEIPSVIAFWFAWSAFHPDTDIYGEDSR